MAEETRKFEKIISSNRNWLSRFGGLLTFIIIVIILAGLFTVKIPQYEEVLLRYNADHSIALILRDKSSPLLADLPDNATINLTLENGVEVDLQKPITIPSTNEVAILPPSFQEEEYRFLKNRQLSEGKIFIEDLNLINCLLNNVL